MLTNFLVYLFIYLENKGIMLHTLIFSSDHPIVDSMTPFLLCQQGLEYANYISFRGVLYLHKRPLSSWIVTNSTINQIHVYHFYFCTIKHMSKFLTWMQTALTYTYPLIQYGFCPIRLIFNIIKPRTVDKEAWPHPFILYISF